MWTIFFIHAYLHSLHFLCLVDKMQIIFSATNLSHQIPVAPYLDHKALLEVKILFQCLDIAGLTHKLNRPASENMYVRICLTKGH